MKFAITPCPNDTFSYYALANNLIESDIEFVFDDIENLNKYSQENRYEVTKLSFAQYLNVKDSYTLLDAGSALGIGTGPVLVGKSNIIDKSKPILVPGINTTAALLLKYYLGKDVLMKPVYFRDIIDEIFNSDSNQGVLIHEGRFVFESQGLKLIQDLGAFWTEKTKLPVPLGCICIRNDVVDKKADIENLIRKSLDFSFANKQQTYPYVKSMAQYLEDDVLINHIYAFVNEYSFDISKIRQTLLMELEKC